MTDDGSIHAFEAFGVACAVHVKVPELERLVAAVLPPSRRDVDHVPLDGTFELERGSDSSISVSVGGTSLGATPDLDVAVGLLDSALRARIALRAPGRIFVHAGAVAVDGRALLVPGNSFSGKTTLVAALVCEGASYLSDEFAVLDELGQVHAYPRPLSLRPGGPQFAGPIEARSDDPHAGPWPVGVIAITSYHAGSRFEAHRASAGSGALALVAHAVPARERPGDTLRAARAAASRAVVLESSRGEADETAHALMELARAVRRRGSDA